VLVATGLHRPNEGAELAEVVGDPWVFDNVKVENHHARDDAAHVDLGVTSVRRTPVKLDRRFVEADVRIATGLVEPHFMAGYSGGRKVIAPGIAHADTIRTFHSARFMEDKAAIQCNLAGQSAARGAARDRAAARRRLCGQHRDRRGSRSRPRQLRRSDRESPRSGRRSWPKARGFPWGGASRRS
jgi:nickel-dependent lactate racemase